ESPAPADDWFAAWLEAALAVAVPTVPASQPAALTPAGGAGDEEQAQHPPAELAIIAQVAAADAGATAAPLQAEAGADQIIEPVAADWSGAAPVPATPGLPDDLLALIATQDDLIDWLDALTRAEALAVGP